MFDADHHQKGGHNPNVFAYMEILFLTCRPGYLVLHHEEANYAPKPIRGHPWSSEGTPEPDRNSRMEEIFVRKSQIVGTRMFLVSRWVWGPKIPLKAFLHASILSLISPGGLPGAMDPGFSITCTTLELDPCWPSAPGLLASGSTALRLYRLLITGLGAEKPGGVRSLGILGKGKAGTFLVNPIKPNVMISLSKPAF